MRLRRTAGALTLGFLVACGVSASGGVTQDIVRAEIGMRVDDLNRQPILADFPNRLSPQQIGMIALDEPHILEIVVNGHPLRFESGGPSARTYIGNHLTDLSGPPRPSGLRGRVDPTRIGFIDFDVHRDLVSLDQALVIAHRTCAAIERAGLGRRADETALAHVSRALADAPILELTSESDERTAFLSPATRAVGITLCSVEDANQSFGMEIRNFRRAAPAVSGEDDSRINLAEERVYRVSATLTQNLERLLAANDGPKRR